MHQKDDVGRHDGAEDVGGNRHLHNSVILKKKRNVSVLTEKAPYDAMFFAKLSDSVQKVEAGEEVGERKAEPKCQLRILVVGVEQTEERPTHNRFNCSILRYIEFQSNTICKKKI